MGPSPDQIRHDIDRTRAELVADANRIVDHTRPRNIAQRRVDRVRHGMSSLKERVMGTVPENASTMQHRASGMASAAGERTRDVASTMGDRAHDAASTVGERAHDAASTVGDKAQHATSTMSDKAQHAAQAVQTAPEQARQQARGNPLAAGLIAFGAGALVATLIPATRAEQDAVRELGDRASGAIEPVKEAVAESAQKLKDEAGTMVGEATGQVKQVAQDATQTTVEQAKGSAHEVTDHARESGQQVKHEARNQ
jgi:gas vesicle protein